MNFRPHPANPTIPSLSLTSLRRSRAEPIVVIKSFLGGEEFHLPSITKIKVEPCASPGSELEEIEFIIESRYDDVELRHLYHTRLVSPASLNKAIYLKFLQRHSGFSSCTEDGLS